MKDDISWDMIWRLLIMICVPMLVLAFCICMVIETAQGR